MPTHMYDDLLQQTNKRLTLNLLIQGAAAHTMLTAHHLVSDELEGLHPGLTRLYDRLSISFHLNYFIGDIVLLYGRPSKFWKRTSHKKSPFRESQLFTRFGGELTAASKRHLVGRGRQKRVSGIPLVHCAQLYWLLGQTALAEKAHRVRLARLAERATSLIWGIDESRLDGSFTLDVAFGHLDKPKTRLGRMTQSAAIGYGGVERRNGQFAVVAKSWVWPLVLHELVKGTAELVCLHGLNTLDDDTYRAVTDEADQIEYETWLLQAGAEMWRRLLSALPHDVPLAEMLMHIARLDPEPLERLMLSVAGEPERARGLLRGLAS